MNSKAQDLLKDGPVVINIGVIEFGERIAEQDAETIHVNWSPPAEHDEELGELLDKLL
jgi:hypothetical protein